MEEWGGGDGGHEGRRHTKEAPAERADRTRLAPGASPPGAEAAARADARAVARLEIADGLVHDAPVDPPGLIRVPDQKAMVADRVDHPRDAGRVLDVALDRGLRADAQVGGARRPQAG